MKKYLATALLICTYFVLVFDSVANAQTATRNRSLEVKWRTHNDPTGYSVDVPEQWTVSNARDTGRVVVRGQSGEVVSFWPISIEQRQLDFRSAPAVLQQLARKVNPSMAWGSPASFGNCVRVVARGKHDAMMLMMWSAQDGGTSALVYAVEAPHESYRAAQDIFTTVLKSFHFVTPQEPARANGHAASESGSPTSYVRWNDPREGAFSLSVPQGWKTIGGAYRLTATDIRQSVTAISPDGQIRVSLGDANVGAFTEPIPMYAQYGMREGTMTSLGDGTQLEIRRYLSGAQFARIYAEHALRRECPDLRVISNNDRSDLISAFRQQASPEDWPQGAQFNVGDVSYTCTINGKEVRGYHVAATLKPFPGRAPLWYVYRLYGYMAPGERQKLADGVMQRVAGSFSIDPTWRQREKQIAAAAVQRDNQRSQQIRSHALAAIAENQRQTSEIITSGYNQRQKTYDEISRKRENAILGKVDVIDPSSHTQYKIDNYSDYHWMDNQGNIAGTRTDNSPGPGWRQMIELP